MTDPTHDIFCFTIDERPFAIPFSAVDRVIRAVEVSPVPNAPRVIHGIFDYHGRVVPVINLRQRLKMADLPIRVHDVFILADTQKRKIALVADRADGILNPMANDLVRASAVEQGFEADGLLRRDDGIVLIYDIEKFLSEQDEIMLEEAIEKLNPDKT
jgi:purine-binding chemotaxis protein CheW